MATLPTPAEVTSNSTTNDQMKSYWTRVLTYLSDLLGADSANKAAARQALGAFPDSGGTISGNTSVNGTVSATGLIYGRSGGGNGLGRITVSSAAPTGMQQGDIWLRY